VLEPALRGLETRYPVVLDEHRKPEGLVSIFHLAEIIGQETTPEDLMISGSSDSGIEIFLFACPTRTGQRIYHTAGLGSMGNGLPGSISVCLAGGGWRTICGGCNHFVRQRLQIDRAAGAEGFLRLPGRGRPGENSRAHVLPKLAPPAVQRLMRSETNTFKENRPGVAVRFQTEVNAHKCKPNAKVMLTLPRLGKAHVGIPTRHQLLFLRTESLCRRLCACMQSVKGRRPNIEPKPLGNASANKSRRWFVGLRVSLPFAITIMAALCTRVLEAQDSETWSKLNTNLGMGMTVPLNPTAGLVGSSVDVVIGAGYNFNRHHSFVGQFMWAGLPFNNDAFLPIVIAAKTRNISSSSNLFTVTANYRYQLQGRTFGMYWIGGGGLYYRRASLSREVPVGTGTVCGAYWTYWGYGCVNGIVTDDQTLISAGSSAFGGNGGMGFNVRINNEGYKFYVESRYHYAPTKNISTQLITITLGFSW
jgi:hypothetical protein